MSEPEYIPTPEAIAAETAKIRRGRDERTELRRIAGYTKPAPYKIPQFALKPWTNPNDPIVFERID